MNRFAVGLDFDHTLGIDNKLECTVGMELLEEAARETRSSYDPIEALRGMENALENYRSGEISLEDALREPFSRFAAIGEAAVMRFRSAVMERAPAFVQSLPGARTVLEYLEAAGISYALLSNGWSPLQEEKARLIGFRAAVFVSDRIGARKPCAQAFHVLADHFKLAPEHIYYVGDDPITDVEGARQAGLISVWFDWENRTYPADQALPTYRIKSLDELPGVFAEGQGRRERIAERFPL